MQRRTWMTAAAVTLAAVLAGCASPPQQHEMQAEVTGYKLPHQPAPGRALVYVVRPSSMGGMVRFNVFVDNQQPSSEVGYTRAAQYIHFPLTPGPHKILTKAENWAEIDVNARAGETIFIKQELNMGVIMARTTLVRIDELEGKFHVKKLEPGTLLKK